VAVTFQPVRYIEWLMDHRRLGVPRFWSGWRWLFNVSATLRR